MQHSSIETTDVDDIDLLLDGVVETLEENSFDERSLDSILQSSIKESYNDCNTVDRSKLGLENALNFVPQSTTITENSCAKSISPAFHSNSSKNGCTFHSLIVKSIENLSIPRNIQSELNLQSEAFNFKLILQNNSATR